MSNFHYVDAIYIDSPIKDYAGNPLTESLPPIHTRNEVAHLLAVYPSFDANERQESGEYRFHYIQRTFDYFQPMTKHIALERKISTIIRQGYINRNPLSKNTVEYMNNSYKLLMQGKLPEVSERNREKKVQGVSLIGISGTGKTTTIERILSKYPLVIKHTNYNESIINTYQIPWMKLECPPDGSTRGLCLAFFSKLDERLKTEYSNRYKRFSVDNMIVEMAHLSRLHNVGVLIIDEIQALSLQKSGGVKLMLNFFVTLVNSIGVPVILIGTNKAFELLNKEFRQALRSTGQGTSKDDWNRMKNDRYWQSVMTGLLVYQWTKQPITEEDELKLLSDALYEESQGIVGIAVKLFAITQMEAILDKTEKITTKLIKKTFKKHFYSLLPMIEAIKTGDNEAIDKYEDLKVNINKIVNDLETSLKIEDFITKSKDGNEELLNVTQKKLSLELSKKIKNVRVIEKAVATLLKKVNYEVYNFDELYEEALLIAENLIFKSKSKKKKVGIIPENDLRLFRDIALENQKSAYEVIKKNNFIFEPYNYFDMKGEDIYVSIPPNSLSR